MMTGAAEYAYIYDHKEEEGISVYFTAFLTNYDVVIFLLHVSNETFAQ